MPNNIWEKFRKFIKNPSCPHCQKSAAALYIETFFIERNCKFKSEITIKTENEYYQFFDFFNEEKQVAIEYDGEQHYIPIYGEEAFQHQKELDNYKNKYCQDNNIKLIRILFWEKSHSSLDKILNSILNEDYFTLENFLNEHSFEYFKNKFEKEYNRLLSLSIKFKQQKI